MVPILAALRRGNIQIVGNARVAFNGEPSKTAYAVNLSVSAIGDWSRVGVIFALPMDGPELPIARALESRPTIEVEAGPVRVEFRDCELEGHDCAIDVCAARVDLTYRFRTRAVTYRDQETTK